MERPGLSTACPLAMDSDPRGPASHEPVGDQLAPGLSPEVELCGRSAAPGFTASQWLIRDGGRFLQVSELLYRVAERLDGHRTYRELAEELTTATEWEVSPEAVHTVLESKLRPLGLLEGAEESRARPQRPGASPSLLARARLKVIGADGLDRPSRLLKLMFVPQVLIAVLPIAVLAHVWMYVERDLFEEARRVLLDPGSLLAALALVVLGGVAHELGHAAALRYSGGRARSMGVGLFVIFPIFYTDVTDAYRFGRGARLRTDLGGFYFHLLFTTLLIGVYLLSGVGFLLITVALVNLDTLRQLIPFIRLDGYWALCDLTGVPDLNQQAAIYLRRLRNRDESGAGVATPAMRRGPRALALVYMAVAAPLLIAVGVLIGLRFPILVEATRLSLQLQANSIELAWRARDYLALGSAAVQVLVLMLPLIALSTMAFLFLTAVSAPLRRRLWRLASNRGASTLPQADSAGTEAAGTSIGEQLSVASRR